MKYFISVCGLAGLLVLVGFPTLAAPVATTPPAPAALPERVLGKPDAPIKVDEYVSLTCSHCAEFYNNSLPEIEKRYVDTGKVRFVFHAFVMDGPGLKAVQVARCMPEDEFFPFIKILYKSQSDWSTSADPSKFLISYAKLGGLSEDKAKACLEDTKLQDAIIAERDSATQQYKIEATPTFVINDGAETIKGSASPDNFAQVFDRLLAAKK